MFHLCVKLLAIGMAFHKPELPEGATMVDPQSFSLPGSIFSDDPILFACFSIQRL